MEKVTSYSPKMDKGLELYIDANFFGNWYKEDSENSDTESTRHGFVISYKGCPIVWKLSLHIEIYLPSTWNYYTELSYDLSETIDIDGIQTKKSAFLHTI